MSPRLAVLIIAASPLIAWGLDYAWCRIQLWADAGVRDMYDTAGVRYVSQDAIDRWRTDEEREKFDTIVAGETW